MKIATKIGLGYGLLIALLFSVLAYQLTVLNQTRRSTQRLSAINFRAAILSLQLLRDLDQIEEFTQKFFVTGDPGYAEQVQQIRDSFSEVLRETNSLELSANEQQEIQRLEQLWRQFVESSSQLIPGAAAADPRQRQTATGKLLALLNPLRLQTQRLIRATRLAIESQVEESARASQRAQGISAAAAALALLASLGVSFWIVRSISKPLRQLTAATRAVAEGRFSHRLAAAGDDELSRLARDFDTMTRRLSELDEMKKDFVSHVSHELKSPLASIQETTRLLLDQLAGPLTPEQQRFLSLNLESSRRLSAMIGNLLDLSRIEAGVMEYNLRPHDLTALTRTALAELEVQLKERNLRIDARLPPQPVPVNCDGDRILQVITNVVGNALKFSPSGSTIQISLQALPTIPDSVPAAWRRKLSATRDGGGYALVSVADSGPGVPDVEKEAIFEKFRQLSTGGGDERPPDESGGASPSAAGRASKITGAGVGLGLAIARTILEAHRSAIWVEDNPGGGSVFRILLRERG